MGIRRACAVIDDGRAGRRAGRLDPIRRVGRHAPCAIGRPAAAADRPYITASAHQFTHDGVADGTRCAEDNVPRTAQLRHRDYPSPGTGIARPANPRGSPESVGTSDWDDLAWP